MAVFADCHRRRWTTDAPRAFASIRVKVANGDALASSGICKAVPVTIGQETFHIDIHVIPLEGYELVLG